MAQGTGLKGAGHRAQGAGHNRAQGTGRRAQQGAGHRAQGLRKKLLNNLIILSG